MVHHSKMSDDAGFTQFKLRLPNELKAMLERAAQGSGRSVSSEMINRLYRSFSDVDGLLIRNRMSELKQLRIAIHAAQQRLEALRMLAKNPDHPRALEIQEYINQHLELIGRLTDLQAKIREDMDRVTNSIGEFDLSDPFWEK